MLMSGALRPSLFIPSGAVGLQVILLRHRYTAFAFEWRESVELLPSASQRQLFSPAPFWCWIPLVPVKELRVTRGYSAG